MSVPIDTSDERVTVDVCVPLNELQNNVDFSKFKRSDSGKCKVGCILQKSHFQKREASKLYILFQIHVLNSVSFEDYKNFDN